MPLIQRLALDHTIREFRAAAAARYREAVSLAVAEDRLAAIYLSGYAVEMLLKAAYFRLAGWGPPDSVSLADLQHARQHAVTALGLVWPGNLHDLPRWTALLVEDRKYRNVPYAPGFARSLNARVKQVYLNWREQLRYRANRPYRGEVSRTLRATSWLLGQYRYL
jgi:hypothetical protein